MDILKAASKFAGNTALRVGDKKYRYEQLLESAAVVAPLIQKLPRVSSSPKVVRAGPRIALYAPPTAAYVAGTWATWLTGGVAVPLALSHPPAELGYYLQDSGASAVLTTAELRDTIGPVAQSQGVDILVLEEELLAGGTAGGGLATADVERSVDGNEGALIIYTSGTTGRPKGALHTNASLAAQVASLREAWEWRSSDVLLHSLPMHHIHGIVNGLYCAAASGATVELMAKFAPRSVWKKMVAREMTVFMGVPTMYAMMLAVYDRMSEKEKAEAGEAAAALRLTVSGSAACPEPIMQRWRQLSGAPLLERYGMTEIGMALSNPLKGERRIGTVGTPLPGVSVRLRSEEVSGADSQPQIGEVLVKWDGLFREYWGRPEATAEAFDADGYFLTGDTAVMEGKPPYVRILGRTSVDILKVGGYKISALEIESHIMQLPSVAEVAVLGRSDDVYGQVIVAVMAVKEGEVVPSTHDITAHCRQGLAPYKVPKEVVVLDKIPRNAMGKVNKKQLMKDLFAPAP